MLKFKSKKKLYFPIYALCIWLITLVTIVLSIYYKDTYNLNSLFAINPLQLANDLNESWWNALKLISALFLHSNWQHWIGNMLLFLIIALPLEKKIGGYWFLLIYLISGFIGNLYSIYQLDNSSFFLLGASGAVSGLLGAWLLLFPNLKISIIIPIGFYLQKAKIPIFLLAFIWLGLQAVLQMKSQQDYSIVWGSHIVGFISGFFVAWLYRNTK